MPLTYDEKKEVRKMRRKGMTRAEVKSKMKYSKKAKKKKKMKKAKKKKMSLVGLVKPKATLKYS